MPRAVRSNVARRPFGSVIVTASEGWHPGVVGLDEPVVMRELAAAHLEHPVALGVVPELLHAPDQPGTGVRAITVSTCAIAA